MDDLRKHIIKLNMLPGVGAVRGRELLKAFPDPAGIFTAGIKELAGVEGLNFSVASEIAAARDALDVDREIAAARNAGADILTEDDADYPPILSNIYDPPLALYCRGRLTEQDARGVAIVGTRRASMYGLETARRLAYGLAGRGFTVISGMARGIDTAAHMGAIDAGGRTIAVLGTGVDVAYPPENAALMAKIAETGALVSEFSMGTQPVPGNFPVRNRIISGLSLGVVVVEAAERSGALITAYLAMDQGREVFSVPGRVDTPSARGPHKLIREGAKLVECVDDIVEELGCFSGCLRQQAVHGEGNAVAGRVFSERERRILDMLSGEPVHVDSLKSDSGMDFGMLSRALLELELKGAVRELPGKMYVKHERE
ncbi:MAG: DNA-processing protein DprA [Candidatus Omnitrophota bacterium]